METLSLLLELLLMAIIVTGGLLVSFTIMAIYHEVKSDEEKKKNED